MGVSILPWIRRIAGGSEQGRDIEAKEEGIGWDMVILLDQNQVVQDAGKSASKSLLHGFDCKKMRWIECRRPAGLAQLFASELRPITPPVRRGSRRDLL